jgi:uncharacterized protein (TIGR03663 family)
MPALNRNQFIMSFALVLLAALALRLPQLEQRPMHGDEAVHAIKFGALLEGGYYRYDRHEYHGPTLNYLTLIPAWLSSAQKLTQVSEWMLRIVPVFFGTLLILLPLLLRDGLGRSAMIVAATLTAVSPAMAYYSRYYIQEMLLVCFTFGVIVSAYRYTQSQKFGWALASGVFLGLMHATKETCIIAWGAMFFALVLTVALKRKEKNSRHLITSVKSMNPWHAVAALAVAGMVSALFYSSFLTNAKGVMDSILTYKTYFRRAGNNELHIHPWHYYLKMLFYFRIGASCGAAGANPLWSEALILILAAAGFVVAMKSFGNVYTLSHNMSLRAKRSNLSNLIQPSRLVRRFASRNDSPIEGLIKSTKFYADINIRLLRFIAFYTFFMAFFYSLIPYKTPWNLLGFFHGMILLAGVAAVAITRMLSKTFTRRLAIAVMVIGGIHLSWQAYLANYKYYENPANPYVYAHPVNDVFTIVQRVEEISQAHPDGRNMYIQVICPGDDYWPLPWYLRAFANIGWWKQVDENAPAAPLIIASPKVEPALMRKLYELPPPGQRPLYLPLFDAYMELRPQIELRGYVRKDLWDRFQQQMQATEQLTGSVISDVDTIQSNSF